MATTEKICVTCDDKFLTKRANHKGRNPVFCSQKCIRSRVDKNDPRLKWRVGIGFWQTATDEEKWQRVIDKYEKLVIRNPEGCWGWKNVLLSNGYGLIGMGKNKAITAHRASWLINKGNIAEKLCVLHRCDNRSCTNPDHLFLGTNDENMSDMVTKKRQMHGVNHYCSKLDENKVLQIRELIKSGHSHSEISRMFNVNPATIQNISVGRTWKDI